MVWEPLTTQYPQLIPQAVDMSYMNIYKLFVRNLLRNGDFNDGDHNILKLQLPLLQKKEHRGKWMKNELYLEEPPIGTVGDVPMRAFASSYILGSLAQSINQSQIDTINYLRTHFRRVTLVVTFQYATRSDQGGSNIACSVTIKPHTLTLSMPSTLPARIPWTLFTQDFDISTSSIIGSQPIQSVCFCWSAKDQQYWAGEYGPKIANITMRVAAQERLM